MEITRCNGKQDWKRKVCVKRFTIPVDNEHLLLVSTEVDADLSIIYNILKLIHG
jgi:hypothetical protein